MTTKQIFNGIMKFIYGTPNITGCLFGLAGLALFFTETIDSYWLPIVAGMYAFGYLIIPKPPEILPQHAPFLSSAELMISLDVLIRKVQCRIPPEMLTEVVDIKKELVSILRRSNEIKHDLNSTHMIHQTVTDYLPRILDTYMKIPPAYSSLPKMKNGKTPTDIAMDQLHLLSEKIKELSIMITEKNIQDLKIHHSFLKAKFADNIEKWSD